MIFDRPIAVLRAVVAGGISYTALATGPDSSLAIPDKYWLRSRFGRLFAWTALILFVLVGVSVYSREHDLLPAILSHPSRADITKEQYIEAVLGDPVEGLLDPEPIRKKCDETQYQEGLIWHCDTVVGGIGNVGNMWLNCVRYAIEAGGVFYALLPPLSRVSCFAKLTPSPATTLILPRLGARSDNLIDLGNKEHSVDLSYLFDVDHFLEAWQEVCPQIHAVVSDAEVPGLPPSPSDRSPHLAPSRVKSFPMRKYLIVDPSGWREAFDTWLGKVPAPAVSAESPVRVWQDMVLAQWNREKNSPAFGNAFPRLFRYPRQTRRLAAATLWSLEQRIGRAVVADSILLLPADASAMTSRANSLGPGRLAPAGFLGAHMRVAADAAAAGWPGYEAQAPFFIAEAKLRNLTTVYLATGSDEHRARFRTDAAAEGLQVLTKEDLLDEQDLAELRTLTWDQQALVDFDVLVHSTYFYGFVRSSFSWALALRRGTLPEAGPSQVTDQLGDEFRDNISAVVGRHPNINPEGMWP